MTEKYEARIFDTSKGHALKKFLTSDPFAYVGRYRIDLFRIGKGGEEKEVDYEFVTFKRNINKVVKKMMQKQRDKHKTGYIGNIKIELDV